MLIKLTKDQVVALKMANDVAVHNDGGRAYIVAFKDGKNDGPYVISGQSNFEFDINGYDPKQTAVHSLHYLESMDYSPSWRMMMNIIKPGDYMMVYFNADSDTHSYLREKGLHGDVMMLYVYRDHPTRVGNKLVAGVRYSATLPDHANRMIRVHNTTHMVAEEPYAELPA